MVRALLEERKTQTRRVLGQFDVFRRDDGTEAPVSCLHIEGEPLPRVTIGNVVTLKKLKAAIGDRLWVREAFRLPATFDEDSPVEAAWRVDPSFKPNTFFEADGAVRSAGAFKGEPGRLRASMHMPRWASRLTLTVTDVRVQRLQEISEEDARAEGVEQLPSGRFYCGEDEEGEITSKSAITSYAWLWNDINGEGSWLNNPWVAAYTFTVERRNIAAPTKGEASDV